MGRVKCRQSERASNQGREGTAFRAMAVQNVRPQRVAGVADGPVSGDVARCRQAVHGQAMNAKRAFRLQRPQQFGGTDTAEVRSGYQPDVQPHAVLRGRKIADVTHNAAQGSAKTVDDPARHAAAQNQRSRTYTMSPGKSCAVTAALNVSVPEADLRVTSTAP